MPIVPLPQFELDLEEDRKIYENLKAPTSIVVRFGAMKMVGEFPYAGDAKPGCGSKFVVRTHRGTELAEMLTSTCPNAGCSKSVTRKEMLEYIENSGGKDYPFFNQGKVLRLATAEDLAHQAALDEKKVQMTRFARAASERMNLPMKVVEAEPILGEERLTFHFVSEQRIDFRDLVNELAAQFQTRIEMHQVGSRDEARLTADYERCGQHCCCKQFLKVLKPVSMKAAKTQKATLDPLKISGRCGRLMCCLRYEEQTYDDLRARLPRKKSRVNSSVGWGVVLDTQILTQLALVKLEASGEEVAIAVEDITETAPAGSGPPPVPYAPVPGPGPGPGDRRDRNDRRPPSNPSRPDRAGPRPQNAPPSSASPAQRPPTPPSPPAPPRPPRPEPANARADENDHNTDNDDIPDITSVQGDSISGADGDRSSGPSGDPHRRRRRRRRRGGGSQGGGGQGGGSGGDRGPGSGPPPGPSNS